MRNQNLENKSKTKKIGKRIFACVLLIATMLQLVSVCVFAAGAGSVSSTAGSSSPSNTTISTDGITNLTTDEAIAELKQQLFSSINKNLVKKISDYELKGEVGVILTFSEDSLIESYLSSPDYGKKTYSEYCNTYAARVQDKLIANRQAGILDELMAQGLISDVKHTFTGILDGAFVRSTYEDLAALADFDGVMRITLTNKYLPAAAVQNHVNVYPTGIFNSSDVSFTGKGTLVAVLDTGCDYTHTAFTTHQVEFPKYHRDYVEKYLPDLIAYSYDPTIEAREVYYGNVTLDKIVFGYDYADKDPNILPFSNSHGTHVAGIIGGKDDKITGVAIDTQFAIMKVFSDNEEGADEGDILAALEDSVTLGVDAINMSLGSSCGFSIEYAPDKQYKNDIYDRIEKAGIALIAAASNDHSSGYGSEEGNTNKTDNPDSATIGSPASYGAAMSVASINGNMENYMLANGNLEVFFHEAVNQGADEYDFFEMLGINKDNPTAEFEYVTIPGYGYAINYSGIDVKGKIALVRRGDITFEEKVRYAYEAGALACIIYNNVFGEIIMTVGNDLKIPVISIGKDEGDALAAVGTGKFLFNYYNEAGPFMSDFSSWGPTPDLKLKPEITAHGGNILSAIVGGEYDELSGTSMAAPNMCGITVLIRQYVNEKYKDTDMTDNELRDLVYQLCMSTATIALDQKGNPYSPRKQGAGIADIVKATTTPAYLFVEGSGRTKLELGDDAKRTGVYTMTVSLKNVSDKAVSYRLGNITITESVSTSDPEYVAEMAYILSPSAEYSVDGVKCANGIVTVEAGKTVEVSATLTLSAKDKAYINSNFANGMYVEGYLTFDNTEEKGIDLNAPFLAFYGDWSEAPLFDLDYYEVETEAHNNAIDDDDKIKADYYATTPLGSYYYDYILPLGSYLYKMDESEYTPIPATRERAAISLYSDSISGIYGVFTGLLRGAREMSIQIVDTSTGKVVWEETKYNCYKAHYAGVPYPYVAKYDLPMYDSKTGEVFGNNNTRYEVTMSATLDWEGGIRNSSDTYSFSFYIDYEAPTVTDASFRVEYDKGREENRYYLDVMVYDNHYAMSIRPVLVFDTIDYKGREKKTYSPLINTPIPIYQENKGESTKVSIEITDYLDIIMNSDMPEGVTLYIDDYALNGAVSFVPFPDVENKDIEFVTPSYELDINQSLDLADMLVLKDTAKPVDKEFFRSLEWTSSDESVVAVSDGYIQALKSGTATIQVTGSTWKQKLTTGEKQIYKSITINVSETVADVGKPLIESLEFTSFKTLFAFNGDIDPSEIGRTDSINYFGGNNSIAFYPSEKVQLNYDLKPWNLTDYTLKWTTSNPKVATVDDNGVVTAIAEGVARISLQVLINGKPSLLAARCSFEVKSEFIVENRTLIAYKGNGGDVVIPDDEGIWYIGSYAFSHFILDNEREVEKDENGYYDMDLKKDAIGNKTVTSVVIPEGVEKIEKYAFYKCEKLNEVTLPVDCIEIESYAFSDCEALENVNFDDVNIIGDYAFYNCKSLNCEKLGGANLSGLYSVGDYAFYNAGFTSLELDTLSLADQGAFAGCTKLREVVLGPKTRVSKEMFKGAAVTDIVVYSDSVSDSAFEDCDKLVSVEFKNDLTYLGVNAFKGCKLLENVTFGAGCEQIADYAFANCKALKSFTLPKGKVDLGNYVFDSDKYLAKITFAPDTVVDGGISLFNGVDSFTVDLNGNTGYVMVDNVIYTADEKTLVLVIPKASQTRFTVPAEVTHIAPGAFSNNPYITAVSFEENSQLKEIGYGAFANCSVLNTVNLPNSVVSLGDYSFYNTWILSSINLEKVDKVGSFAFSKSFIKSVNLGYDGVTVGAYAFYGANNLSAVALGKGATINSFAFAASAIRAIDFLGGGVTVNDNAFYYCTNLSNVDFADISGKIGDFAFFGCTNLTAVNIPEVTELGEAAFADCTRLASFVAPKLTVMGSRALAAYTQTVGHGAPITTIDAPALKTIGDYAFFKCIALKTIDLSGVTEIGEAAFATCTNLTTVVLSKDLKEIKDYVFVDCYALANYNIENVVKFGFGSFAGVKFPEVLNLTAAEYIGARAFVEYTTTDTHTLKTVNAPNLISVDEMAFSGATALTTVNAPKLQFIGDAAFTDTSIVEFEVSDALKHVGMGAFYGAKSLKAFYATVDGEKVYDKIFTGIMIKDGVLYVSDPNGYTLSSYPMAKTDKEFAIADGTTRIDQYAFFSNLSLEKVILPGSLDYIGDYAFYACDNLKTVVFNSYYAPVLESSPLGAAVEILKENVDQYPGFDSLYKYSYYYRTIGQVAHIFYYRNFVDIVTGAKAMNLTYVVPENSSGYDSAIYKAYFGVSEENSGVVMGPYAIAFIDAVNKIPEKVDRFNIAEIEAAILAYNALVGKEEEKYVDSSLVEKFNVARSAYNVSVAENKLNHLFDMDNSKYSFDLVKDARETVLALSEQELAALSNAAVLDTKISELAAAMGKQPDFSITYEEHFPKAEEEQPPVGDDPTEDPEPQGGNGLVKAIIITVSVVVALIAAYGVVYFVKIKKNSAIKKGEAAAEGEPAEQEENAENNDEASGNEEN